MSLATMAAAVLHTRLHRFFPAIVGSALALTVEAASAEEITTCRAPSGTTYVHYAGATDKKRAGWRGDRNPGDVVRLVQNADLSFDILYTDPLGKPTSSVQDAAVVRLLRKSADTLTLLVHHPDFTTEIYSFFREKDGHSRFTLLQSMTGPPHINPKSSVLLGACDPIRFERVRGS